jgi:hypothetical protein
MTVDVDPLAQEIEAAFPHREMPREDALTAHDSGCQTCLDLRSDLEQYRGKAITVHLVREIHQELRNLSAEAWLWILPHYLRYGLTPEAEYTGMEIEFLVYSLDPAPEFRKDAFQRLSLMSTAQIDCLIHFLDWCLTRPRWKAYFPESLGRAIDFVSAVKARKVASSEGHE